MEVKDFISPKSLEKELPKDNTKQLFLNAEYGKVYKEEKEEEGLNQYERVGMPSILLRFHILRVLNNEILKSIFHPLMLTIYLVLLSMLYCRLLSFEEHDAKYVYAQKLIIYLKYIISFFSMFFTGILFEKFIRPHLFGDESLKKSQL